MNKRSYRIRTMKIAQFAWINKDRVRDQTLLCHGIAFFEQVGTNDTEIIVRDMGKCWSPFHITHRLPSVVLEIVAGIIIGPSVLGWVKVDLVSV